MPPFLAQFQRYRLPILLGAGAVAAYAAYTAAQQRAAAGARAAASAPGAPLDVAGYTGLVGFGAETALRGQQSLVGIAQGGLNLGGLAVQGARAVAEAALGNATAATVTLGDVAGQLVGAVAAPLAAAQAQAPAPPPVYTPQPTPAPRPAPAPQPAPSPAPSGPSVTGTESEYRVVVPGNVQFFAVPHPGDGKPNAERWNTHGPGSWANAARLVTSGVLHWQITNGGMMGWSLVPGRSAGAWYAQRATYQRLSDGTRRLVGVSDIGQSGS